MKRTSILSGLTLLFSLTGCGAGFLGVGSTGAVAVNASADGRTGSLLSVFADAMGQGGAASVAPGGVASSGGPAVGASGGAAATVVAASTQGELSMIVTPIISMQVHASGPDGVSGPTRAIGGGALALETRAGLTVASVVGGDLEIESNAVEGAPCGVRGGTVTLEGGVQLRVTGGRVTLGRAAGQWVIASGRVSATTDLNVVSAQGASGSSVPTVAAGGAVGGAAAAPSASAQVGVGLVVMPITSLRVRAGSSAGVAQAIGGGAVAIEGGPGLSASTIVSGDLEIEASAVEGTPCSVLGGTVTLESGVQLRISGGRVTLARAGGRWVISTGRINAGAAPAQRDASATVQANVGGSAQVGTVAPAPGGAVPAAVTVGASVPGVDVERMSVDGGLQVIVGGEISIVGIPSGGDLTVVDGDVDFDDADLRAGGRVQVRGSARRALHVRRGGSLLVSDRRGHRWRCRVEGGEINARTDGTNPSGRVVWQGLGGELRLSVLATGGDALTLEALGLPEVTVQLSARVRGALNNLVAAAPAGSPESARLAAAVEIVMRNAESSEPSFYAIPVRGRSLVLMVDISYSMSDPDPQGSFFAARPTKLDVARAELVKVLASIPAGVSVNVIAFSSHVSTLWPQSAPMGDAELGQAVRWVGGLRPADETHPLEAMQAARALNPDQIVLLSDGRPSDSEAVLRSVLQMVDTISATARVDVVGFGADQDRQFLGELATHGHGTLRLR